MPKWNGGVIGVANNPTQNAAKGVWSLSEATKAIRAGLWPPSNAGADPYFENVTLLLPGDGTNGAQNNTFLDSSTNNFTITRNGNTTQGTFTPFSKVDGRWGNYFDGSGDYLTVPYSSQLQFTGDFTIEFWAYPLTQVSSFAGVVNNYSSWPSSTGFAIFCGHSSASSTKWCVALFSTFPAITSTNDYIKNAWSHIALVRSGTGSNNITLYVNGVAEGTATSNNTVTGTANNWWIGATGDGPSTQNFTGYLSNFRAVNSAVYTGAFTPSTSPLTAVSGTKLLTCQSNRFIDNSTNAFAITPNGNVAVSTFSPFPTMTAYAAGTNGGSGYFDGSGDYLTVANSSALSYGTGSFTIEGFFNTSAAGQYASLFSDESSGGTSGLTLLMNPTAGNGQLALYGNGSLLVTATGKYNDNAWHHFAISRDSTNLRLYVDGAYIGSSASGSTNFDASSSLYLMSSVIAGRTNSGYLSSFRTLKGTALYTGTSSITVPTSPLTAITNTSLLLNFTNGGIIDTSMSNDLETVGNAQISTTQSKFGGASMYFDGNGDYLIMPDALIGKFGTGDFTVEYWDYHGTQGTNYAVQVGTLSSGTPSGTWRFGTFSNNGGLYLAYHNGTNYIDVQFGSTAYNDSTWRHFALTRQNGTVRAFVNGTQVGSNQTITQDFNSANRVIVGADLVTPTYFAGYIDDLRITKGVARYTANFTAPSGPFIGFGD